MGENDMDMSEISAEEIKAGRERMRMTQQQLADAVSVSLRTVSSWERGQSVPRNRAALLADVLELDRGRSPEFGLAALKRRIGFLAKQRREELGIARVPFARAIGVGSDKTIQTFEFGRGLPMGSTVHKIEKALGWRVGVVSELLEGPDRKASDLQMEDLDEFEPNQPMPLDRVPTEELLSEVIRRLTSLRGAIGTPQPSIQDVIGVAAPHKDLFDLAASSNVEHLEDEDEDEDDSSE
jgi:DNA-binding transcriptional regulator YiaG